MLALLRPALCGLLFAWSLLSVFRAPFGGLWKLAVAATEWGHLLALLALVALLPRPPAAHRALCVALSVGAALLFLSPLARAQWASRRIRAEVLSRFHGAPRALPDAPSRVEPLSLPSLVGFRPGPFRVERQHLANGLPLDVYLRDDAPPGRPVILAIHGGSWNSGDPTQVPELYRYLAARGWVVVAITYRLAPAHTFPAALDDVRAAQRWVRDHAARYGMDPSRTVLYGRSAGGHLALLAAYTARDPSVRAVVALYPPSDLAWSWNHPTSLRIMKGRQLQSDFLGGSFDRVPEAYQAASPYHFVRADVPPTLLLHGRRDELVFFAQTERFAARLRAVGAPAYLLDLPWASHGCEANPVGPCGQIFTWALERFLADALSR